MGIQQDKTNERTFQDNHFNVFACFLLACVTLNCCSAEAF